MSNKIVPNWNITLWSIIRIGKQKCQWPTDPGCTKIKMFKIKNVFKIKFAIIIMFTYLGGVCMVGAPSITGEKFSADKRAGVCALFIAGL